MRLVLKIKLASFPGSGEENPMKRAALLAALVVVCNLPGWSGEPPLFQLELNDGVLTPRRLEVPAGKAFRLEVRNVGRTPAEFESKALRQERVLAPGTRAVLAIRPLAAGTYLFVDEFRERLDTARGVVEAK
jgi:hypothetical protein